MSDSDNLSKLSDINRLREKADVTIESLEAASKDFMNGMLRKDRPVAVSSLSSLSARNRSGLKIQKEEEPESLGSVVSLKKKD